MSFKDKLLDSFIAFEQVIDLGFFLSYRDYHLIKYWLKVTQNNPDPILLILNDLSSEGFFDKKQASFQRLSLKKLDAAVQKRLKACSST